jgi:hypothetical protein
MVKLKTARILAYGNKRESANSVYYLKTKIEGYRRRRVNNESDCERERRPTDRQNAGKPRQRT